MSDQPRRGSTRTTIRFPPDVYESLDSLRKRTGAAIQFSVVEAVRQYLLRPEIKDKLRKRRST